jgi:hypothetical protein
MPSTRRYSFNHLPKGRDIMEKRLKSLCDTCVVKNCKDSSKKFKGFSYVEKCLSYKKKGA